MKFAKSDKGFVVRLVRGEKIIETLHRFCDEEGINSGFLSGIGGASDIELGFYNLDTKEYQWKVFPEVHEVLSILGNVSLVDEKPFIHAHMVISNNEFHSFGGHLREGVVAATLEVLISPIDISLNRKMDDEIGLKLLDL